MRILTYPNWKQRIVFDDIIYKDVRRFSLRLNSVEREIIDEQIAFYRTYFSIYQVMNYFKTLKNTEDKESFVKKVPKNIDNILFVPNSLKSHFKTKIKNEFDEYSAFFTLLLDRAMTQNKKNLYMPLCKKILGGYYKKVMKSVNHYRKQKETKIASKTVKPEAYMNVTRTQIKQLQEDMFLAQIFGRSKIRNTVPISIVDTYGYGEWISKQVSFGTNRFFIYSNNYKLSAVQLEHMVYFNVYPGYAHFYENVVDVDKKTSFDNGATYLINGWAMYAMCHSKNSAYSTNMLIEGSYLAKCLLSKNIDKGYEDAYVYLHAKYPKDKAIEYMLDYTQYPGHYLSYILGGFAVEHSINGDFCNGPEEFLKNLSEINCGDFFAIYSAKKQKAIAKKKITAKVAKKFAS